MCAFNVILFSNIGSYNCNISIWNWIQWNIEPALWVLMAWCFSTRASVATVPSTCMHPCVSSILWDTNRGSIFFIFCHFSMLRLCSYLKSFHLEAKDMFIPLSWYLYWWWPDDTRSHGISSHCVDLVPPEYSGFSTRQVNLGYIPSHMYMGLMWFILWQFIVMTVFNYVRLTSSVDTVSASSWKTTFSFFLLFSTNIWAHQC